MTDRRVGRPANRVPHSLNVSYRQVLVDYFEDANDFWWHHRLLLVRTNTVGEWIAATPTHGVCLVDLKEHRVIPLERNSEIPADVRANAFIFEELSEDQLDSLMRRAYDLAGSYGMDLAPIEDLGRWVISDTASDHFGKKIPNTALSSPDTCVMRDTVGLVRLDERWLPMEKVAAEEMNSVLHRKHTGPGRDKRIACEIRVN